MYQSSLERKLKIPFVAQRNGKELGLGRFYVGSHHDIARVYAKYTCDKHSFVRKPTPIICSIYIDSTKLPYFRKTYIPRYVHKIQILELWGDDEYMNQWERIISSEAGRDNFPNTETIRFAKFLPHIRRKFNPSYIGLQSAWPKEALKYMVAKCRPSFDYTEDDKPVDYSELLIKSQNNAAVPPWGQILGSKFFSPGFSLDKVVDSDDLAKLLYNTA
ncbi:hypothetical protein BKA69DRAFT_1038601 [Paraphysoderma sedebokerense]|nr:hypothetical protein BKA69DRAFT_1038601 [Paraphysoderma sedebokerense]